MAKLHLVTGLASERGYIFQLVARHEFRETLRDVVALFIERVFPEQACQHTSPQLTPRIDMLCHGSFVRPCRKHPLPHIQFRHLFSPPSLGTSGSGILFRKPPAPALVEK